MTGSYRDRFHIPRVNGGREAVYLAGHSLGLQPRSARVFVERELEDWERLGVEGHFQARNPWMPYHRLLTAQTARLVGALPSEVVVMNSLTVNLHLLMVSFYRPTRNRHKILIEGGAFPSDRYAADSQIRFHGFDPSSALVEAHCSTEGVLEAIHREGESIALVLLAGVNYATGEYFDIPVVTAAGRQVGAIVGVDLAHAAGNVPLELHRWGVDFAAWCSYKYLNGGPGAVGGCFVHEKHAWDPEMPRFEGWWGHEEATRFRMPSAFRGAGGAEGWQLSNPPILQLAALRASMEVFDEAGMESLRARSRELTGELETTLLAEGSDAFEIITPSNPDRRGAQLSIRLRSGDRSVCDRLNADGVIIDWREPDILRVAPAPLYNTSADIHAFARRFLEVSTRI